MRLRGGTWFLVALTVCVGWAAAAPALVAAATVSGAVGDQSTHTGIAGVDACFRPEPETFETRCDETDSAGHYEVADLPEGKYVIRFSADRNNLKYVSEYYDDASNYLEMDLFTLNSANATIDAELAQGGSIAGTLTDEESGLPVAGVRACALDSQGFWPRCVDSDANGVYQLNGIPSGVYSVEYEGGNRVNYLHEFYEDAATWAAATDVTVASPAVTPHIDAELVHGAELLGHVTDPVTGAPSRGVFVCANEQDPGEYQGCDTTDEEGNYAIRSLPAGTYLVAFELEYYPSGLWAKEWWQGAATMAEADPIVLTPPETRTGIDGRATSPYWPQQPEIPGAGDGTASSPPPPPPPRKPLKRCRKGFHRKLVKGKKRCVRKHHPRHKHRR
jgi:hypothetical protein